MSVNSRLDQLEGDMKDQLAMIRRLNKYDMSAEAQLAFLSNSESHTKERIEALENNAVTKEESWSQFSALKKKLEAFKVSIEPNDRYHWVCPGCEQLSVDLKADDYMVCYNKECHVLTFERGS